MSTALAIPSAADIVNSTPPLATVVDSPLPSTPAVEAPAAAAVAETPAVDEVSADIKSLAESVGLTPDQFAGYKDLASAEAAVSVWLENAEKRGVEFLQSSDPAVVGRSAPVSTEEPAAEVEAYKPLDLAALGLKEDEGAAKAIRLLEQQALEGRQALTQVITHLKNNQVSAKEKERLAVFQDAQRVVADWKSPLFGVPGPTQTVLQQEQQAKLYRLARSYELDSIARKETPAPLAVRLNRARFKLGDKGKAAGPVAPTTILPEQKSGTAVPATPGSSYSGQWSKDPTTAAKLRAIR